MKVYLDNCCYNRVLDNRSNSQIYYERNSVMLILELVEKSVVELIRCCSNIKYKDSIHLACAEAAKADVLLKTDKRFVNNGNRIKTYTKIMNPNQWLSEVLY